ncbi:MAG: chromosome segregation ATPase [Candidatus Paceibacteria bacterium]|jgi:chromosome segregation ATPase
MNLKTTLTALALLLTFTGCALPSMKAIPAETAIARPVTTPGLDRQGSQRSESKLYARDGSVVGSQQLGTTTVTPNSGQLSQAEGGTRWTLLEQYQTALSEKEQLQFELQAMASALDQAEARERTMAQTVAALQKDMAGATTRVETLEGHNVELAARLTTAQIRRLQSEKLLLEAKLDWRRIQAVINTPEATSKSNANEAMPGSAGPLGGEGE